VSIDQHPATANNARFSQFVFRSLQASSAAMLLAAPTLARAQAAVVPLSSQALPEETQVNTYTADNQASPAVAMDADGDYVVVYNSYGSPEDPDEYGIRARMYNADGTPKAAPFQVNTVTTGWQRRMDVAMDANGDFVVAWHSQSSNGTDSSNYSIQARRYNKSGVAQGGQFQVNTFTSGSQEFPQVALDHDGDFVVVWAGAGSSGTDNSGYSIHGQRYNSVGTAQGGEFQVNSYTTNFQSFPSVAMDQDGNFVVAWDSDGSSGTDSDSTSIQAQRYNSSGTTQGPEFQVNEYTTGSVSWADVAMTADGDFVIAWESVGSFDGDTDESIQLRYFDNLGTPLTSQLQANASISGRQTYPVVEIDSDGEIVVIWSGQNSLFQDTGFAIHGQHFGSGGQVVGQEFQVNTYTTGTQDSPAVAMDSDGDYVVAWESVGSAGTDTEGFSIQAQVLSKPSDEQVNTFTGSYQYSPAVATDADGDFVVVWASFAGAGDTDPASIRGQRFDRSGDALGPQFQVNTYTTNDQSQPAVAMDSDGDFVVVWTSYAQDGSEVGVHAQRFDADGVRQGSEFQVNTYTTGSQQASDVAMDADGDFVVTWQSIGSAGSDTSATSIQAQRYNSHGTAQGAEFQVNTYTTGDQTSADVGMDDSGDFVIVWSSEGSSGSDTSGRSIQGQRYNSSGSAQGAEFQLNAYTTGLQWYPDVALDADGDFVATWESYGSYGTDSSDGSIQAQRYNSVGTAQGGQFQVNASTVSDQWVPQVDMDSDGDFVITWQSRYSFQSDSDGFSIQTQFFAADGSFLGFETQVNTYTTGGQNAPSIALDADGDLIIAWASDGSSGNDSSFSSIQLVRFTADGAPLPSSRPYQIYLPIIRFD
jgi:hypothetical protein